ncbi:energy-coupling factor transporter transmembrane protein EcfT, partial [Streptococcus suis]
MDKLILGRYIHGYSIIHLFYPRSKLLAMFGFLLIIFLANNLVTNALLIAFFLGMVVLSRIRLSFFIKGLKPMI